MLRIGNIEATYTLQRWVGLLSGAVCVIFAVLNTFIEFELGGNLQTAIANPAIYFLLALAAVFIISATADKPFLRGLQVVTYFVAGVFAFTDAERGNMTGFLFTIFSLLLYNEYGKPTARFLITLVLAALSVVASILLAQDFGGTYQAIAISLLFAAVVVMYGLVGYRQLTIRRRAQSLLEARVEERTLALQEALAALQATNSELVQSISERDAALDARDQLIQEIHHRIGNSLQILSSYLSLKEDDVEGLSRDVIVESELRIHAIAQIHNTLHSLREYAMLPLDTYLQDLCADLQSAYYPSLSVDVHPGPELPASVDFILPMALVITELITNSVKHSGHGDGAVRVKVSWETTDESLVISVGDDGSGFPSEFERGQGFTIMDELVSQNKGTLATTNDGGALVTLSYPTARVAYSSAFAHKRDS